MKQLLRDRLARQPSFREAVRRDTHMMSFHRGEFFESDECSSWYVAWRALRLMWVTDAFFAQVVYRARMSLMARGIPVLPRIMHRISIITAQLSIDELVILGPGANFAHGRVGLGGLTEIGINCSISPWITIGLRAGSVNGPTIGDNVFVGVGAKVLGEVTVGDDAVIGAMSLVNRDVPAGSTVAGIPARVIETAENG